MPIEKFWTKHAEISRFANMVKAMAHPARMAIMYLLCSNKSMTVKCIYNELKLKQPVISRHLGILKNGGLVIRRQKGAQTFYELNLADDDVKHISKCFKSR